LAKAEEEEIERLRKSLRVEDKEIHEKLVDKILEEGGINAHVWLPKKFASGEYKGDEYENLRTNFLTKNFGTPDYSKIEKQLGASRDNLSKLLAQNKVNELIDIRTVKSRIYKEKVIPGRKGFLGIGKIPDKTIKEFTGKDRPVLHSEIVKNGKKEPAVLFTYLVASKQNYREANGRRADLTVTVTLPESTAKEFEQVLNEDSSIMRKIVEKSIKEKMLSDEKFWEEPRSKKGDPLRPPWEEWDAELDGGRVYIQKEGKLSGWQKEYIHQIKK